MARIPAACLRFSLPPCIAVILVVGIGDRGSCEDKRVRATELWDSQVDAILAVHSRRQEGEKLLRAGYYYLGTQRLREARELARSIKDPAQRRLVNLDRYVRYFESVLRLPEDGRMQNEHMQILHARAHQLSIAGNHRDAIHVMEEVVDAHQRLLGRDNPIFRVRQMLIARFYFRMGDYENAGRKFEEVLHDAEASVGKDSAEVGMILVVWATLLRDYDRNFARSEQLLRRGLAALLENEPESINCARAYGNLAKFALWTGRLDDAEALIAQGLQHAQRWYPTKPREAVSFLALHGYLRGLQGNPKIAREELQQVLKMMKPLIGTDDAEYLQALTWLARILVESGELDEAERQLREILRLAGDKHVDVRAQALRWMAGVQLRRGVPEAALELLTEARKLAEQEFGPDHRIVIDVLAATAPVLRTLSRAENAEELEERIKARNIRVARNPAR